MIRKIIGYTLGLAVLGASIYVRFSNPDMTETQLIIAFWPLWAFMVLTVFIEMWLFKDSAKK